MSQSQAILKACISKMCWSIFYCFSQADDPPGWSKWGAPWTKSGRRISMDTVTSIVTLVFSLECWHSKFWEIEVRWLTFNFLLSSSTSMLTFRYNVQNERVNGKLCQFTLSFSTFSEKLPYANGLLRFHCMIFTWRSYANIPVGSSDFNAWSLPGDRYETSYQHCCQCQLLTEYLPSEIDTMATIGTKTLRKSSKKMV